MMFSIVIPTRARPDTLRHALRTALAQTDRDFEIIVHESGEDPETSAVVAEFDDPRIRFFKTVEPVLMTENWERALRHASGDYVVVIGDDDGLLPDACTIARSILRAAPAEILSWYPAFYMWPRYIDPELANGVFATCGPELTCTWKSSRSVLNLMYRSRLEHNKFPMIYHSFVSRKLIERVRGSRGHYFVGSAPDVTSGVANLCFSERILQCNRPLSLSAVSHHSTGTAFMRGDAASQAHAIAVALGEIPIHPTMVPSFDSTLGIANQLLLAKQEFFPHDDPQFGYAEMLEESVHRINEVPTQYDAVLADYRAIAEKNGIEFDETDVPPRVTRPNRPRVPIPEHREIQSGTYVIQMDGATHAAENVFDACAILAAQLPPVNVPKFIADPAEILPLAFRDGNSVTFDFTLRGNGAHILRRGWGYLEPWGVASLGARSELTFPFDTMFRGALTIQLIGFVFSPPRTMSIRVKVGSRTLLESEVQAMEGPVDVELSPIEVEMTDDAGRLDIVIGINRSMTRLEAGTCPDPRPVGFGLNRIVISRVAGLSSDSIELEGRSGFLIFLRKAGARLFRKMLQPMSEQPRAGPVD